MSWKSLYFSLLIGVATLSCGSDHFDLFSAPEGLEGGSFVVRLSDSARDKLDEIRAGLAKQLPGVTGELKLRFENSSDEDVTPEFRLSDLYTVKFPNIGSEVINQELFKGLVELKDESGLPLFEAVDTAKKFKANFAVSSAAASTEEFSQQYYLDMIRWSEAMASEVVESRRGKAEPVIVAILDTGIAAAHEDLTGVLWEFEGLTGFDATANRELTRAMSVDENGHGTHVAGIIGANGDNANGIHGVGFLPRAAGQASLTEIMNIQVLNAKGNGKTDQLTNGIKWAVDKYRAQKAADPARANQKLVLNMSLGNPFETDGYAYKLDAQGEPVLVDDVFAWATAQDDVLIVVAAGNEACGIGGRCKFDSKDFKRTYYYPCSYKGVLCVGATNDKDQMAEFSNRNASIGIVAPGYQIISTISDSDTSYGIYSGTSQSTPVVAGAASVVWSLFPDLRASEVAAVLQRASARVPGVTGAISTTVGGRLDLSNALQFALAASELGRSPNEIDPELRETTPIEKVAPPQAAVGVLSGPKSLKNEAKKKGKKTSITCGSVDVESGNEGLGLIFLIPLLFVCRSLATHAKD